jgi:hypothetical protein
MDQNIGHNEVRNEKNGDRINAFPERDITVYGMGDYKRNNVDITGELGTAGINAAVQNI